MISGNDVLMYSLERIFDISLFAAYRDSIFICLLAGLFIFGHLSLTQWTFPPTLHGFFFPLATDTFPLTLSAQSDKFLLFFFTLMLSDE